MRVSEMPTGQKPADRARSVGVGALTTVELVTLALGLAETRNAETIMKNARGSLRRAAMDAKAACATTRFTETKVQQFAAVFELGRRWCAEIREESTPIRSPKDVVAFMAPKMEDLPVEEFHVLILDAQHRLEHDVLVTRGILNSSLVHPREVFRQAIVERAAAIILVHNHPSGDPAPSADDRNVTDQLVAAGRMMDIPVHDHVIIGRGRYTSFAEAGLL